MYEVLKSLSRLKELWEPKLDKFKMRFLRSTVDCERSVDKE